MVVSANSAAAAHLTTSQEMRTNSKLLIGLYYATIGWLLLKNLCAFAEVFTSDQNERD